MPRWNSSIDVGGVDSPLSGVPDTEVEAKLNELAQQHGASVVAARQDGTTWNVTFESESELPQLFTELGASGVQEVGDTGTTGGLDPGSSS